MKNEIKNTFETLSTEKLVEILGLTIKRDEVNKLITFLAMLSAYTEDSQLNISFNAPSSSGKSFIPLEIARLFPQENVIKLASASATAFYHEQGKYDKETNTYIVDLSHKIIIFLDQPSTQLLCRLRSLLSHDDKEIQAKITDKNQRGGNRTKTVIIKGFPVVIYCTATFDIDEQEATRFILLSPDITQEKIRDAVLEKIRKESNKEAYVGLVETDPLRLELMERIRAIKELNVSDIRIGVSKQISDEFFKRIEKLKTRHQRDIARILNLVKLFALLNLWDRKKIDGVLYAEEQDVKEAFKLWDTISESQELNLPPHILKVYREVLLPAYWEKNGGLEGAIGGMGLARQDIMQKYYAVYNSFLADWLLRQKYIPLLETAGLIVQEADSIDKRKMLIFPTSLFNKFQPKEGEKIT